MTKNNALSLALFSLGLFSVVHAQNYNPSWQQQDILYRVDQQHAYFEGQIIPEADIASFRILNDYTAEDKNFYYVFGQPEPKKIKNNNVLLENSQPSSPRKRPASLSKRKAIPILPKKVPTKPIPQYTSSPQSYQTPYEWPTSPSLNRRLRNSRQELTNLVRRIINTDPLPTPDKVKGVYLTSNSFSSAKTRQAFIDFVERTELNTLVIDIQDSAGAFSFQPKSELLNKIPVKRQAFTHEEYKALLTELQNRGIYTIARIVTFQDHASAMNMPELGLKNNAGTLWENWKGIMWLDMTNPQAWSIPVEKAKEAALLGFDEIQFDYIRFPSDGPIGQAVYADLGDKRKYQVIANFYQYAEEALQAYQLPMSVDLFGLTYHYRLDKEHDMNIGQRLADAAPYFDYISPMVYPSHYPSGYLKLSNPAAHPYEVIHKALGDGTKILSELDNVKAQTRPWIQDFDMGADYDANMVRAQIKACDEHNTAGWLLWNARNVYTEAALKKAEVPQASADSFGFETATLHKLARFILNNAM